MHFTLEKLVKLKKHICQVKKNNINITELIPIGTIIIYSGICIPDGWLLCDGSELKIKKFKKLYSVISTTYGGDGIETFILPDLNKKTVIGSNINNLGITGGEEEHLLTIEELPSHYFTGITEINGNHNHSGFTNNAGEHNHGTNITMNTDDMNEYGLIHKSYGAIDTINQSSLSINKDYPDLITKPLHLDIYSGGLHRHIINEDGIHNHNFITNTIGLNKPINIMQPYIYLKYLIKC